MNSDDIRGSFLNFFSNHGHKIVGSSSLLPDAPNLLFTNAGMNQFVPIFLGNYKPSFTRAADTQKCMRAGGKHNDLDDVGFDTYHHTFFEMLGNWSFGDYFKKDAIEMAWELLTKVWEFPKNRLYATVYSPSPSDPSEFDQEAYEIWSRIFKDEGINPDTHIITGDKHDNFWMMGNTGPCGPCSEIHMDLTADGNTEGRLVNKGSPWCIELWNLVFMQFNAKPDGSFETLKNKHVDTGMGFERVVGIFAKTKNFSDFSQLPSNYDSDLFVDIFDEIERSYGKKYRGTISCDRNKMSTTELCDFRLRAIADHIRALTFAIADGIFPSNDGRGYVLRRILRRAVMFGKLLGLPQGFFSKLSSTVIKKMGNYFHELIEQKEVVENVISNEESAFSKTLDRGISIFDDICKKSSTSIAGEDAFLLYDTYGFPLDLIQLMASERNMTVNVDKFDVCMDNQRTMARCSQKKSVIEISDVSSQKTNFVGYDLKNIESFKSTLTSVIKHNGKCFLIFSETVFYAECGGQVGDHGTVKVGDKIFKIVDVQKDKNGCYLHEVDGDIDEKMIGEYVVLSVDKNFRRNVSRNHSATHILQYALRSVLGTQVKQAGSYVDDKRLRFDFNAISAPTVEELNEIETIVLTKILECEKANVYETPIENIPDGCLANFGEKYGNVVRVVEIGNFSKELCGGCHVENTSEIAYFKIVSCSSVAAGIRRIEAVTGEAAFALARKNYEIISNQCKLLNCSDDELQNKVAYLIDHCKDLEKKAKSAHQIELTNIASKISKEIQTGTPEIYVEKFLSNMSPEDLRTIAMKVIKEISDGTVVLSSENDGKCSIVACCSESAIKIGKHAGNIVKEIAQKHNGSGGGKPEFAMGGYAVVKDKIQRLY